MKNNMNAFIFGKPIGNSRFVGSKKKRTKKVKGCGKR